MNWKLLLAPLTLAILPLAALAEEKPWQPLLDPELSQWEAFIGVPHATVEGIPGVASDSDGMKGTPLGLNNDPKKVFSIVTMDNEPVLRVSGEIYGGLTTRKEFSNYRIRLQVKWGERKWAPRLEKPRDSGLLYHCIGEHGAMWNVWMRSLECQIQEQDCGDFFSIVGTSAMIPAVNTDAKRWEFKPGAALHPFGGRPDTGGGRCARSENVEHEGEWNTIEVYTVGDRALHVVNGRVNNVLLDTRYPGEQALEVLDRGKIQIQSEGAEVYYRRIEITPISEFPEALRKEARLE